MTNEHSVAPEEKRMRLRYAGVCHLCDRELPSGEPAVYERAGRRVRCIACTTGGLLSRLRAFLLGRSAMAA